MPGLSCVAVAEPGRLRPATRRAFRTDSATDYCNIENKFQITIGLLEGRNPLRPRSAVEEIGMMEWWNDGGMQSLGARGFCLTPPRAVTGEASRD